MKLFGFIIITYNRPAELLDLLTSICALEKKEEFLEEVIIVNNKSTVDYSSVQELIDKNLQVPIKYIVANENLGVSKGRNFAIQQSTAPILLVVDDDTTIQTKDCFEKLEQFFYAKNSDRETAIVSFKVLYEETKLIQKNAFPHKCFHAYKNKSFFETYYYPGCAHAIKKEVLNKTGFYPDDFFYGMEEYDLSYRILNEGYSISYTNSIVLHHKESPLGRSPKKEKLQMLWVNKSKVAWRYLPKIYFYSTSFLWSLYFLRKTNFDFISFIKIWKTILKIPQTENRKLINEDSLAYLKKVNARLSY